MNYDLISPYYDDAFYKNFNEENLIISLILDYFVKTYKPKTVSDFGSGTGAWIKVFIENNVKNIFAFDCSDKMLKICRSKYLTSRVVTQRIDFTKSSLILKSDLILCAFFFNAISFKYFFNIIENIYNSLNNNGLFIFVDNVTTKNKNFQELVIAEKWGNKVINCKYSLYKFDFLIKVFSKYRFEILFKYLLGEDLQIIVCKKID